MKSILKWSFRTRVTCRLELLLMDALVYDFAYVYEATEVDKRWRSFTGARTLEEASVDLLWISQAVSNTLDIRLE